MVGEDIAEMKSQIDQRAKTLRPAIKEAKTFEDLFGEISDEDSDKLEYFDEVDTAVAFFTVASELIDTYTEELFVQRIIDDEFLADDGVKGSVVVDQLSRKGKYNILRHFEILEEGTNNQIKDVVHFRDSLVHDPEKVFSEKDLNVLSSRFETALGLIDDLDQRI